MNSLKNLRTWIEIDARAAKHNYTTFRRLIDKKVQLWSVVKSNAYGHGLFTFSALMNEFGVDGFCVDSIVEGVALRRVGIKKPIVVLGQTLASRYAEAARENIIVTVSNMDALRSLARIKNPPQFHIKMDTGMHRQGFYVEEVPKILAMLKLRGTRGNRSNGHDLGLSTSLKGLYTHFASAKDINYPGYTDTQLKNYEKAVALFEKAGFKKLMKHAAATGGALINKKYHFDAVRVGIGLYGLWPSKELEVQLGDKIKLQPVLSWRTRISEIKKLKAGDYVGYDLTERVPKATTMAVLPIGYWHGFPRALSSLGEVIVKGQRARVLGRVSMDILTIELPRGGARAAKTGAKAKPGDIVTIIGKSGPGRQGVNKVEIHASEPSQKSGTSHYEFLTRLNPLMERVIIR